MHSTGGRSDHAAFVHKAVSFCVVHRFCGPAHAGKRKHRAFEVLYLSIIAKALAEAYSHVLLNMGR